MAKKPRIVVEDIQGEGVRVRVDHAYSQEHAIYMLSQAITTIVLPEEQAVEVNTDAEDVQELPVSPELGEEQEEEDVSKLQ